MLGIGKEELGLYILKADDRAILNHQGTHSSSIVHTIPGDTNKCSNLANNKTCAISSLWHQRLGNAPLKVLRSIDALHSMQLREHHCTVCPIAKQSRLPFPTSSPCSKSIFDIVHGDVWCPYRVPTHDGKKYFLTLVDDYSRYTWLFLLHSKSDTIEMILNTV